MVKKLFGKVSEWLEDGLREFVDWFRGWIARAAAS